MLLLSVRGGQINPDIDSIGTSNSTAIRHTASPYNKLPLWVKSIRIGVDIGNTDPVFTW